MPSSSPAVDEDGRYVHLALYERLESFVSRMRSRTEIGGLPQAQRANVERFLYQEARLLDRRQYQQWFQLLAEDFVYWIPSRWGDASLRSQVAVNFDDRRRMLDRIAYTESGGPVAQFPPSRTARTVSNVEAWEGADATTIEVTAKLVIWEYRRQQTNTFAGTQSMMLHDTGDGYRIRAKVIELLNCDEPQGNNSFIL